MYGDPQLIHVDKVLTQISVSYHNRNYVGDMLFPSVPVEKQSDKYLVEDKNYAMTVIEDLRTPNADTPEVPPMTLSRDSYFAEEHALKDWVPVEEMANQDPGFDVMGRAVNRIADWIQFNREDKIQTLARTTGNYATGNTVTLSGTSQWSDYTNSNPIKDLKTARDQVWFQVFQLPTVAILSYPVATILEDHPAFLNRVKTGFANDNALDYVGALSGIPKLIRAGAPKNTAALGLTASFGYMWGKDVVLAYVPATPGRDIPAYGYEFTWTGPEAQQFGSDSIGPTLGVQPADRWFDADRKAWAVRSTRRYAIKFVAVDAVATGKSTGGYLIQNAIA